MRCRITGSHHPAWIPIPYVLSAKGSLLYVQVLLLAISFIVVILFNLDGLCKS